MLIYEQDAETIELWQWGDPALRNLTEIILDLVRGESGRVLDVGCGTGRVAVALARQGFQVDAVDAEPEVIKMAQCIVARLAVAVNFYVGDFAAVAEQIPAGSYDMVVCVEVLEHVADWRKGLREMRNALRPGGVLVLTVPHDPGQFSILDEYAGHWRRFVIADLEPELEGFQIEHLTTGFPLLRLIIWFYDRVMRLTRRPHTPERLWQRGSVYRRLGARLLYALVRVDNLFNHLNFGTTLVIKARKL